MTRKEFAKFIQQIDRNNALSDAAFLAVYEVPSDEPADERSVRIGELQSQAERAGISAGNFNEWYPACEERYEENPAKFREEAEKHYPNSALDFFHAEYKRFLEGLAAETVLTADAFTKAYELGEPFQTKERLEMLNERARALGVTNKKFTEYSKAFAASVAQKKRQKKEEERAEKREFSEYLAPKVSWILGDDLLEPEFIQEFNEARKLRCVNGRLYDPEGAYQTDDKILNEIQGLLLPYYSCNVARKSRDLLAALKNLTYTEPPTPQCDRIHVINGYVEVETGKLVADCEFTFYRMAVKYEQAAPAPSLWLAYLADLLEPDDVQTFQEFLGYCMIPSTKAQKMLYMIGSGGEGKSLAGVILKALFGDCMTIGTLHELEARFGLADVEGKLLFLDDDLRTAGLTESANVKTLVTASTPVRIERKGVQAYQAKVACRLMAFGNQIPDTIYDHTNGAYRRRIILRTKEKPAGRVDDPNLADKIVKDELPGVFNWMLAGLQRLHANSYRFTIGEAAQRNLEESKLDAFSPAAFFADEDAVQLGDLTKSITSANLYAAYCQWCKDNCLLEVAKKSFFGYLSAQAGRLRIRYDKHLPDIDGRRVLRGYYGIELLFPVRRFEIIPDFIP